MNGVHAMDEPVKATAGDGTAEHSLNDSGNLAKVRVAGSSPVVRSERYRKSARIFTPFSMFIVCAGAALVRTPPLN
jgi:hypothetical protein